MSKNYLHFIPNLSSGGAEKFLLRLIPELSGHHTIVTYWRDKRSYSDYIPPNASHISINPLLLRIPHILKIYFLLQKFSSSDRVFSWLYMSDVIASIFWLLSVSKFKLIWNVRNSIIDYGQYSFASILCFHLSRSIFHKVAYLVVFNSYKSLEQHIKLGYPKHKSRVIYNGFIDFSKPGTSHINIESNHFNIACVARFHPQKNHMFLLEALSHCRDLPFKLHLVGHNLCESNSSLASLLNQYVDDKYLLYGIKSQTFVHNLFSSCDVSILASKYGEGFPNVIAESMLQGCYPICFDVGDACKIVSSHGSCMPISTTPSQVADVLHDLYQYKSINANQWSAQRTNRSKYSYTNFSLSTAAQSFSTL